MAASNTAGTVKAPGLPNITGYFEGDELFWYEGTVNANGAFYKSSSGRNETLNGMGSSPRINFDASRSNSIYGASNTVQPPAVTVRFIIKY